MRAMRSILIEGRLLCPTASWTCFLKLSKLIPSLAFGEVDTGNWSIKGFPDTSAPQCDPAYRAMAESD